MKTLAVRPVRLVRPIQALVLALALGMLTGGLVAQPGRAADPSVAPMPSASAGSAVESTEAMCQSAANLRLYVGFVLDQPLDRDGILPMLVGAVASISEARTLADLVSETYRPLVTDLRTSLEELRPALQGLRGEGSVGSRIAALGEAITGMGTSMDALSTALQEPCAMSPAEPASSAQPMVSPAA